METRTQIESFIGIYRAQLVALAARADAAARGSAEVAAAAACVLVVEDGGARAHRPRPGAPADDYPFLRKPFTAAELLATVKLALPATA